MKKSTEKPVIPCSPGIPGEWSFPYRTLFFAIMLSIIFLFTESCKSRKDRLDYPLPEDTEKIGVVQFYSNIPENCSTVRGLNQSRVKRVFSVKEMRKHYGMTMHVWFQDGISPEIFGSMYYQNKKENRFCMALPDGRFAVFGDYQINQRPNMSHEICYPIKDCVNNPGFLSAQPDQKRPEGR